MNILFIGNFEPSFSTENDRAKAFNQLGHTVLAYQENRTTVPLLTKAINDKKQKINLVVYSHTHGWDIPGLKDFFQSCRAKFQIPTASVHLDRWAWLERESDIGKEATWFTEYQFMADFSPEAQELYKLHNLNAHYLKPGVNAEECVLADPDLTLYPHPIIFVGSSNYHSEYAFRPKLISWLKRQYQDLFAHYGPGGLPTIRGLELNKLYASAQIVVGDSCFGGRPNYVSDRYYETRGRGGLLLHPHTEGHDVEGVIHYDQFDCRDLTNQIEFYLDHKRDAQTMRTRGFNAVKNLHTYTHRAQEMLEIIGKTYEVS